MRYQMTLNIETETLSQREQWLVERLRNYKDLALEIEGCHIALSTSAEPPSITIRPQEDDDPYIMALYAEPLMKEHSREIAATIERNVDTSKWQYVSVQRVHNALLQTHSDDLDEDYAIRDAVDATRRRSDERVEMTPTERAVIQHEAMQESVRKRLRMLEHQKRVMDMALGQMQTHYPEWHELLWRRYVKGEKYETYIDKHNMSPKLYKNERHRALLKFDKLAVGLC